MLDVSKALFSGNDRTWSLISDKDKEECFFIFNRYLAKGYIKEAGFLNLNKDHINAVSSMNLWFHFMKGKGYPKWFWSKPPKVVKEKDKITKDDFDLLLKKFKIKAIDLDYLIENHFKFVKDELKYFKSIN